MRWANNIPPHNCTGFNALLAVKHPQKLKGLFKGISPWHDTARYKNSYSVESN